MGRSAIRKSLPSILDHDHDRDETSSPTNPLISILAIILTLTPMAFGINALLRPAHALSFFEIDASTISTSTELNIVEIFMAIYGVRDIFMGFAIAASAIFGNNKTLGLVTLGGSGVAFADGLICRVLVGRGEWAHWGSAGFLGLVGGVLMGC